MITQETIDVVKQYEDFVDEVKAQISFLVKSLSSSYNLRLVVDKGEINVTAVRIVSLVVTKRLVFSIDIVDKSIEDILQEVNNELKWL